MKLNILALASLLALAVAQDASGTSTASSATTSLPPQAKCAQKCAATDRCCIAACYEVPCPSDSQANDTNDCVAACPQGTGTPADTERYAACQANCFKSHFFPISGTGAASKPTGSSSSDSSATGTGSGADSTGTGSSTGGSSESGTGTATGTGAASTETENAAVKVGMSAMGVIGMAVGIWAL